MEPIRGFAGEQIAPSDSSYDESRAVFNAMVDKRPALIARCTSREDVALALAHAQERDMPVAVRAGGHSVAGLSLNEGGLVIDVRPMADVTVDAQRRIARCGAGATWSEFDRRTQQLGLATTGGRVSSTGVTGLTLGGGSGWLERKHGLTCDNLIGVELIAADGERVLATEYENPELLWAHKGGGGNFGVVTALEFRLHEVGPMIYGGLALYDPADGVAVATALRDFSAGAPDEAGLAMGYLTAPPEPFVPAEWQGRLVAASSACGPGRSRRASARCTTARRRAAGREPVRRDALRRAAVDDRRPARQAELVDGRVPRGPARRRRSTAYCAYSDRMPAASFTQSLLIPWGGAVARNGDATPLTNRDAGWVVHPFCVWEGADRDAEHMAWGREVREVFAEWTTGATYLNFIGDEGADRVRAAFGADYDRLATVKASWDPDNVFRGNQNIAPAAARA